MAVVLKSLPYPPGFVKYFQVTESFVIRTVRSGSPCFHRQYPVYMKKAQEFVELHPELPLLENYLEIHEGH